MFFGSILIHTASFNPAHLSHHLIIKIHLIMRQFISTIYLLLCVLIVQTNAQVTIDQGNFPRPVGFTDTLVECAVVVVPVPSEGANKTWDYSFLATSFVGTTVFTDATASTAFPGALNSFQDDMSFQGMNIPSITYRGLDSIGWYALGRRTTDISYSLLGVTGSSNDTLRFVGGDFPHTGRINWLEFPTTYPNQWTNTQVEDVHFELTVSSFGLNKTPGVRRNRTTNDRTVVGYGTLKIPRDDASTTIPMDVLMVKVVSTRQDSFFLGGAPAPPALIQAFGVVQGGTTTNTYYLFYKPGFGKPILNLALSSTTGVVNGASYRRRADAGSVNTNYVALMPVQAFPNPISAGGMLNIQAENTSDFENIQFIDLNGRMVSSKQILSNSNNQIQTQIPSSLSHGMYFYTIQNKEGATVGNGKLLVK